MHKDVEFTVEKGNKAINYLDLTLTVNSKRIGYKIYRKPTCTNTIIPKDSFHHPKHKMAAMENYCHRARRKKKIKPSRETDCQSQWVPAEEVERVI